MLRADAMAMWRIYLDGADPRRPTPRRCCADLAGAPRRSCAVAEHDVLRDEGLAYARALGEAGVAVSLRELGDMPHGVLRWGGASTGRGSSWRSSAASCAAWPATRARAAVRTLRGCAAGPPGPSSSPSCRGLRARPARGRAPLGGRVPRRPGAGRRASEAVGAPWHGRLRHGVLLPAWGPGFVTWDAVLRPLAQPRLAAVGHRRARRDAARSVAAAWAVDHPGAPPLLVADLSRPHGGPFGERFGGLGHASHQNGLDADVAYPRRDGLVRGAVQAGAGRPRAGPGARRPLRRRRRAEGVRRAPGCGCAARGGSSCSSSTTTTTCTCACRPRPGSETTRLGRAVSGRRGTAMWVQSM